MELRDAGCEMMGREGCGRWKPAELVALRATLGTLSNEDEIMRLSVQSGTPMYLTSSYDVQLDARRAVIQDAEWRKGILALEQGVVVEAGTFPDRKGRFHWGHSRAATENIELDRSG